MGTSAIERRRHPSWPEALKREIVAASFAPGASVSVVARQYDVNANQVFSWRKRYSRRSACTVQSIGFAADTCGDYRGTEWCRRAAVDRRGEDRD